MMDMILHIIMNKWYKFKKTRKVIIISIHEEMKREWLAASYSSDLNLKLPVNSSSIEIVQIPRDTFYKSLQRVCGLAFKIGR